MWMLNSPWVFSGVWRLVKGMLDKRTVSKIEFVGSDYGSVLPNAHFPPQCLLASMGGESMYEYDFASSRSLGVLFPIPDDVAERLILDDALLQTDPFGERDPPPLPVALYSDADSDVSDDDDDDFHTGAVTDAELYDSC